MAVRWEQVNLAQRRRFLAATALVATFATVSAALGAPVRSSIYARATGDEPEYLLTALSLAEDGSLDVSDEIERERYRAFHEVPLAPQARVLAGGRMVSPHDPLLPALLAPAMGAGGYLPAKLTLSLMAGALAALLVWTAVWRFGVSVPVAALAVGVFAASAPLAVYGSQVYPEIPAALALTVGIAGLTGRASPRNLVAVVMSVVTLSWLGTKFVPVAAALAVLCLVRSWRAGQRKHAVTVLAVLGASAGLYLAGHLLWYGAVTAYATGAHFAEAGQFRVVGIDPDYYSRATRLIGLIVDGRFGLAAWQPAWLLIVPAVAVLLRRRPAGWTLLALPLLAGWLTATFLALTMHGFWFPGRQVVVVLPATVLAVAWWAERLRGARVALGVLGGLGVLNLGWLFWEGHTAGMTLAVHFQDTSSPVFRVASAVLPHYMQGTARTWVLHGIWLAVLLALAALALRREGPGNLSSSPG